MKKIDHIKNVLRSFFHCIKAVMSNIGQRYGLKKLPYGLYGLIRERRCSVSIQSLNYYKVLSKLESTTATNQPIWTKEWQLKIYYLAFTQTRYLCGNVAYWVWFNVLLSLCQDEQKAAAMVGLGEEGPPKVDTEEVKHCSLISATVFPFLS